MPPVLALLLCTGFVLVLLRLERRQAQDVSLASWVPTVWLMACASKSITLWLNPTQELQSSAAVEAGSPLDRALLVVLIAAGIVILGRRGVNWKTFTRNNLWLLAIYVYAFVSIAWSDFTFISIKRYIRFSGTVIMALVILTEPNPRQTLQSMLRRAVFVLIPFSLMLIKYYPNLGVIYVRWSGALLWTGTADHKNSLGILCFASSFYLFWRLLKAWEDGKSLLKSELIYSDAAVFVLAAYLLKGPPNSYSASSISVFLLGVGALLTLFWMKQRQRYLAPSTVIIAVALLFIYGLGTPFGLRSLGSSLLELLGRDATFTDRDQIWGELIPIVMRNPVFGTGYGGFWVHEIQNGVNEAHNGYLNVILELGFLGILLVFGFIVSSCIKAHAALSTNFWLGSLGLCFVLMIVLHNTSEASFLRTSDFLWSLLVFVSVLQPVAACDETVREAADHALASEEPVEGIALR